MPQVLVPQTQSVSSFHALEIAEADGIQAYRDLSGLRIEISKEDDRWLVKYFVDSKGRYIAGGGPHYVIDAKTGEIVSKVYYQ